MPRNPYRPSALAFALAAAAALAACRSKEDFVAAADREVYGILDARLTALAAGEADFSIVPPADSLRSRILSGEVKEVGPLSLVECLEIAAEDSDEYRSQRESLFLEALGLTLDRWRFGWQPTLDGGGSLSGTGDDTASLGADATFRLQRLFGSGARIIADIGASLFRLVSTGDGIDVVSDLGLTITQPLLRGFGSAITLEPLTQAERNLVYQVRSYERFRRTFAVDVAEQVYSLLEAYDGLANEERNLENLLTLRRRNERLREAGMMSDIEADQAKQDELRSQNRLVALRGDLARRLDTFKVFLGLPLDCDLTLDRGEFDRLTDDAALLDVLDPEYAVRFAWEQRLDVATSAQQVEDSERGVAVAADDLRAGLGLTASGDSSSDEGRPLSHRSDDIRWTLALDADLPIDRLAERNTYRAALVRYEAESRSHERFLDRVASEVRDSIRRAANARASYQIQVRAVELAERRVRSADLNLRAGRASTRDVLESQSALLEAQNAQTAALIDFTLALLRLYLELEVLRVDETGIRIDAELTQRITEES